MDPKALIDAQRVAGNLGGAVRIGTGCADRALQFPEAARPAGEFDDHEYRPFVPDAVQDIADPAVRMILVPTGIEVGGCDGYLTVRG